MAWKGHNLNTPNSDKTLNILPDNIQNAENYSNVTANHFTSRDSGELSHTSEPVGGIPKVGPYKKSSAIRRDLDLTKDFKVDIIDVDTTIMEYIDKGLDLSVMDNGNLVKVPVLYASPERWFSVQKYGHVKDNQGKILLPLFLIKRTRVENNKELRTLNRYLDYPVTINYNEKNKYNRFDLMKNSTPSKQVFNVKLPDHVVVSYECIIWTDYIDQNNKIVEKINFSTHDYWGLDRFRFRTRVEDYNTVVDVENEADRNVKTTFNLIVNAYLLPETFDGVKSTTQKTVTYRKIILEENVSSDILVSDSPYNPYGYLKKYVT